MGLSYSVEDKKILQSKLNLVRSQYKDNLRKEKLNKNGKSKKGNVFIETRTGGGFFEVNKDYDVELIPRQPLSKRPTLHDKIKLESRSKMYCIIKCDDNEKKYRIYETDDNIEYINIDRHYFIKAPQNCLFSENSSESV